MKARSLVVAGVMALASGDLLAYRILESRYHVEVGPDKYIDQLVLRCEDGHTVTVPWQSQLAESCREDLMGNVTLPAATADAVLVDEQQKQTMLAQLRSQYGNISEKQVEFISGPSGLSTRFKPPMVAVLKSYESCRKTHKDKTFCAGERDSAMAQLADAKPADAKPTAAGPTPAKPAASDTAVPAGAEAVTPASSEAAASKPATHTPSKTARHTSSKSAAPTPPKVATPTPTEAVVPASTEAAAPATVEAVTPVPTESVRTARAQPAAPVAAAQPVAPVAAAQPVAPVAAAQPAQPSQAEARAAAEQKIADDYASCMRAKPKFECEQSRSKAITALDGAKSGKLQRQNKSASAAVGP
jgi:hypothetical protein